MFQHFLSFFSGVFNNIKLISSRLLAFFSNILYKNNNNNNNNNNNSNNTQLDKYAILETHNLLILYWNCDFMGMHDILELFNELKIIMRFPSGIQGAILCYVPKEFILLDFRSNTTSTVYKDYKSKLSRFSEKPISQVLINASDPNNSHIILAFYNCNDCLSIESTELLVTTNNLIPIEQTEEEKTLGCSKTHDFVQ